MSPGYLSGLTTALQRSGVEFDIVSNLAIGNTSSLMGLMRLKERSADLRSADLIMIEYCLNDSDIYRINSGNYSELQRWCQASEGLLRFCRQTNPNAMIVSTVLASKHGVHRKSVNPVHAYVHYFARYYDTHVIDLNMEFRKKFGSKFYDAAGVYLDPGHYSRPIMTTIAGEIIATDILNVVLRARVAHDIPPPNLEDNFSEMQLVDIGCVPELPAGDFVNSGFSERAFDLFGRTIHLRVSEGIPVCVRYICVEDIACIFVRSYGRWYRVKTLQPGMVEPKYKFLVSNANLDCLPSGVGINEVLITATPPNEGVITDVQQHVAIEPVRPSKRLPICAIGCTGNVFDVNVLD
ncbi:MAG: SGNH/GDSL hydrolase family protein [Novosphingobium sp.]|nr:SGNH/GDSL hydrolase family protein [Novosphingobium sp.]